MPDLRLNLQVKQDNVEQMPEGNGWPTPLTDPSNPLKMAVTNGSNGTQSNFDPVSTSQQDNGEHHLSEGQDNSGAPKNPATSDGSTANRGKGFITSQQKRDEYSDADSE